MKGIIDSPENFGPYHDVFLFDNYGDVKPDIMQAIYMQPFFSHLVLDKSFFCAIYWNDNIGYWCGDLWDGRDYVVTYICDTPEEIKEEVLTDHDCGFEEWG
jgi:hypothetical protein